MVYSAALLRHLSGGGGSSAPFGSNGGSGVGFGGGSGGAEGSGGASAGALHRMGDAFDAANDAERKAALWQQPVLSEELAGGSLDYSLMFPEFVPACCR